MPQAGTGLSDASNCLTVDLEGLSLAWAVATVEYPTRSYMFIADVLALERYQGARGQIDNWWFAYAPQDNPAHSTPIIDRERVCVIACPDSAEWVAFTCTDGGARQFVVKGPTMTIAAMRCHVLRKLGSTVVLPKGLTCPKQ